MKCPVDVANWFRAAALEARLQELSELQCASNIEERRALAHQIVEIRMYYRLCALLEAGAVTGDDRSVVRMMNILREMCRLAPLVGETAGRRQFLGAYLLFLQRIHEKADTSLVESAAREFIAAATAAGMHAIVVEQLRSMCKMVVRGLRIQSAAEHLEAEQGKLDQEIARYDEMNGTEKRSVHRRLQDMAVRVRSEARQTYRFVRQATIPRASLRRGSPHSRSSRARRSPRRAVARRAQADSGGASDAPSDGPGEPPGRPRRSLVAACGLATTRPGRPRDQTSTARFDARAQWIRDLPCACGRGPYSSAARVASRLRDAASEAPSAGPVRVAHGGGRHG